MSGPLPAHRTPSRPLLGDSGEVVETWVVDKVVQAPGGGRWYATDARLGRIEKSGDDLSAERKRSPEVTTTVIRFLVDFK